MIMDNQTTYNEAMAKLAEVQKCQDEIAGCNYELQQVNDAIIEMSKVLNSETSQKISKKQLLFWK